MMPTLTEIIATAHTEAIRYFAGGGYQVDSATLVPVGTPVILHTERLILAHPLDVIALEHTNVYTRLDTATGWILTSAHRRLDALAAALAAPEERDYVLPTILEYNAWREHLGIPRSYDPLGLNALHAATAGMFSR